MNTHFERNLRASSEGLPAFKIAFQPIVNVVTERVIAYEALTRSAEGLCFPEMVAGMDERTLHRFHRSIAAGSIRRAVELGLGAMDVSLCLNMKPDLREGALDARFMQEAVAAYGLNPSQVVIELTEDHHFAQEELQQLLLRNKAAGFATGMDDFGAGYAGLTMLVQCQPDLLKLDRVLIKGIDSDKTRQTVTRAVRQLCVPLGMALVAEGVETAAECRMLRGLGIELMQGYFFSRPVVDALVAPEWPRDKTPVPVEGIDDLGRLGMWLREPERRGEQVQSLAVN